MALTEFQKNEIKSLYYEKTSTELAEQYGVSRGIITKIWKDAGLKGKKRQSTRANDLTGQTFGELTVISKTENRNASGCIMWLCKCSCGNYKEIASSPMKQGKIVSCGCLSKKSLELGRNKINDLTGKTFGKLKVIERCENKILGERQSIQFLCECECGRKTKVLSSNLVTGNTQSCGYCSENSHGNIKIEQLLKEANLSYVREKKFPTCKDKKCLPFDFYVEDKYLIEYDGKQHFEAEGLFNYEKTQKHDNIKNQWCKDNNIPLIRIPYTHYNDLELKDLILETTKFLL